MMKEKGYSSMIPKANNENLNLLFAKVQLLGWLGYSRYGKGEGFLMHYMMSKAP